MALDFDGIYNTYKTQVYGFIRMRADQDVDAQDIAQDTWEALSQKLPLYDPARGSLRAFALYWAGIMLLRYYSAKKARHKVEILFSELLTRYPDLETAEEVGEVMARLTAHSNPSVEEEAICAEDAARLAEAYDELLRITFEGPSPPHQLLAFGFCKLVAWRPRTVVTHCSDTPLRTLVEQLVTAYVQQAPLAEQRIRSCFEQLRQHMEKPVGEVITDANTRQIYRVILRRIIGDTTLREYYTHADEPTANITQWWHAVKRRVLSTIQRQGSGSLAALLQKESL